MILMKDIIKEGHPNLSVVSKPLMFPLSLEDITLGKKLLRFVINSQNDEIANKYNLRPSVGIAAPQINVLKRMFAINVIDFDNTLYSFIFINPEIIKHSSDITYLPTGEGCLSVDRETSGFTPRYSKITIRSFILNYNDNSYKQVEMELEGYPSIVFQHELDHLNGILYTEKLFKSLPNATPLFDLGD